MLENAISKLVISRVYSVSSVCTPQNASQKRKDRPRWAINIKYEGETLYQSNGKSHRSDATHIMILPKGCSYEWRCTKAGHFISVEFEGNLSCPEVMCINVKNNDKIYV